MPVRGFGQWRPERPAALPAERDAFCVFGVAYGMADLEQPRLKVGFIPIIDCAPIVLADELGAFERQGLEVEMRREVSWANVRDKLALGVLDASHILAPLPLRSRSASPTSPSAHEHHDTSS